MSGEAGQEKGRKMSGSGYRSLTQEEIDRLCQQGCIFTETAGVMVAEDFNVLLLKNVVLEGEVTIGSFAGRSVPSICNAVLRNVSVGNGCIIRNIGSHIANADIRDGAVIENTGVIECRGESSFGNGVEVSALNEAGGREMLITELTSAQEAYLSVLHRGNRKLCERLREMAQAFADTRKSNRLTISEKAVIRNVRRIENVNIGPCATIDGASKLKEGAVCSSEESPTTIGSDVIAEDFIIARGANVSDGAMVSRSFIGEGTKIGKQFSCEQSLMFANCEGMHSEVCSLFAGPYSVTHHRSTLLIAAMTSFYNAGSGTNQSNHMYKLGPVHQGILERGCKTGSFSYLLWPSRVGAFTAVMGKHYANFDSSDLPFSYVSEEGGKSTLIPGMNLFTVGTTRDADKWLKRDRRKHEDKLDLVVFDVLSPYTGAKMIRGHEILSSLQAESDKKQEYVKHNGILIKRLLLRTCGRYYRMALDMYLGDIILGRLEESSFEELKDDIARLEKSADDMGDWVDMCGMLCAGKRMKKLVADIAEGKIKSLDELAQALREIHGHYREDAFCWALSAYGKLRGGSLLDNFDQNLQALADAWKKASLKFFNMVKGDASKEFEDFSKTGFGIDGGVEEDFEAVRGRIESNSVVQGLEGRIRQINERHQKISSKLR
ncbi:MAG: DUF4954 family protein [Verrucomicrobiota bacterium]